MRLFKWCAGFLETAISKKIDGLQTDRTPARDLRLERERKLEAGEEMTDRKFSQQEILPAKPQPKHQS
jgi:hypothetical protein